MLSLTAGARATGSYSTGQAYSDAGGERILRLISGLFELLARHKTQAELEHAACAFVAEQVRADRVVLIGEKRGADAPLDVHARWTRGQHDPEAPLQLSGSIIRQVTQARESVLVSADSSSPTAPAHSFIKLNLRSAMAAPLFDNERVRGIIYVDTSQPDVRYEQADIEVLTATANAVAVKLRNLMLESEMQMGAEIQRLMLPALPRIEGYDVAARYVPARTIGGDLYDFIDLRDGRFVVLGADVTGKGLPAALLMANTQATMRAQTAAGGSPAARVGRANDLIHGATTTEMFVTAFYAELDTSAHRLAYCNAGHEPPYLLRHDGTLRRLEGGGLALGILPGFTYSDGAVDLQAGDTVFMFTDGVTDAVNESQELFGTTRVEGVLREHAGDGADAIAQAMIDAVDAHVQGNAQFDDLTLVVLKRR
jgi:sigma-B regulation protein RsbU (phosphoserine phosphatase)